MGGSIVKKFFGPSSLSVGSALLNMLTTVCLLRWFGTEVYSSYIVDLAKLSLLFIVLELLPTSYSIFRVQDDPAWGKSIAAHTLFAASLLLIVVSGLGYLGSFFGNYSHWIAVYVVIFAFRRYIDIRLQSSGRLKDYMKMELFSALLRLVFMAAWFFLNFPVGEAAWATLALGAALSQVMWWVSNQGERNAFASAFERGTWSALLSGSSVYVPYYLGVVLKRLKDNFVPLAADIIFTSRDMLAAFFLAQRGLLFAVGQIRIFEALLNHRAFLEKVSSISMTHQALVAFSAQIVCLVASFVLVSLSGVHVDSYLPVTLFSFVVWPIVFFVIDRAKAYSKYGAKRVNFAIFAYLVVAISGTAGLILFGEESYYIAAFIVVLFVSESAACYVIRRARLSPAL